MCERNIVLFSETWREPVNHMRVVDSIWGIRIHRPRDSELFVVVQLQPSHSACNRAIFERNPGVCTTISVKNKFSPRPRRILLSKYLDSYLVFFHSCGLIVGFFNNFFWLIAESYTHVPHAPKAASLFLPRLIPACCYEIGSLSIYLMKQNKKEKQRTTNRYNTTFSWKPTHIRAGRVVRAEANMTCTAPDFEIL